MIDQILQQQGGFYGSNPSSNKDVLGKDAFLKLLVTQLQHQDPLNPLDDKQFIAQLAQFSSLEQMNNVADGIKNINDTLTKQDALSAANYIGKTVVASGNSAMKIGSASTPIYFTLKDAAAAVTINVYDQNNNIVSSQQLNSMQAGEYHFSWDGTDYNGNQAPDGRYNVYFAAEGPDGNPVFVDTQMTGVIVGISRDEGSTKFTLSDGRQVDFDSIISVAQPVNSGTPSTSDE